MTDIQLKVEALIFSSENGITLDELAHLIDEQEDALPQILKNIEHKYKEDQSVLELKYINKAYQFLTKPVFHDIINTLQSHRSKKKLSQAALETLAIIAYRQPITKLEIEHIRGVNCDYSVQRLLEKNMIKIAGKAESVGKPLLYVTSEMLMDYFGINDMTELPQLREITPQENTIGEPQSQSDGSD